MDSLKKESKGFFNRSLAAILDVTKPKQGRGARQGITDGLLVSPGAAARAAGGTSMSPLATCPFEGEQKGAVAAAAVQDVAQMSWASFCP